MRTSPRAITAFLVAGLVVLATATGGHAAAGQQAGVRTESVKVFGDQDTEKIKDNRTARLQPNARQLERAGQLGASARWNALGTPSVLAASAGKPLASGLKGDPAQVARDYVAANLDVLGLTESGAAALEPLTVAPMGEGAAVIMRQRFGDLPSAVDGVISIGVRDGEVWYVSSSLASDGKAPEAATLTAAEAASIAKADAGVTDAVVAANELVAVPTADRGARAAYEVVFGAGVTGPDPIAYTTYVDARDGTVLVRENLVDNDSDNPEWEAFESSPPLNYSSRDTRQHWCFGPAFGCDEVIGTSASPAWDLDVAAGTSTQTTKGNSSIAVHNWFNNNANSVGTETATASPDRDYNYAWTNQWFNEKCNPDTFTSPQRADIDAARANLFAMHNRMHDWAYHLGFTEATWNMQADNQGRGGLGGDFEQGNAQAGGVSGGPPDFAARDNANQITPREGLPPITNMYMWQPIAGSFYAPCVDGDYDMSVIGHEYTHAITNRMIAGPNAGLSSPQGMSESWSDLMAMEYLNENGYAPPGKRAYTVGQYVTSDPVAGIRNYNMSDSPLNYSSVGYDFVGLQVHASGEVWSATNFDIRQAMIKRYGDGNSRLQKSCAMGQTPVTSCPGNRRWVQLVFDSFLLMANSQNSQVDARDALLAADLVRFGGANQDLLWNAFAKRGLGEAAVSNGSADANPTPGFTSPFANEATLRFTPVDEDQDRLGIAHHDETPVPNAQLFVGVYQARAVPVADTDDLTPLTDTVSLVPGKYEFVVRAPGHGHVRVGPIEVKAGQVKDLKVKMPVNLASASAGATATGDGINLDKLIDDDEVTNWASLNSAVAGKQVTIALAGGAQKIDRVNVSAMLRPQITTDPDSGAQSRYSAVRQFRIWACEAKGAVTCATASDFHAVYTSKRDAFPSVSPRPRSSELIIQSFNIPNTKATHLRIEVLTNQCIGGPDFAGEQDNDPRANTDCSTASVQALNVRIAEFQAFAS